MARFNVTLNVQQQVTRRIKVEIDAEDEEEAGPAAIQAVQEFPREILTNRIHKMISIRDEFTPPVSTEVTEIREDKRFV